MVDPVLRLIPHVQKYEWGVKGPSSLVGRLYMKSLPASAEEGNSTTLEETTPYAELWMGLHPSGMSRVVVPLDGKETIVPLDEFLNKNPGFWDRSHTDTDVYGEQEKLTYLFKVLSVACPLSIQAHPDKQKAIELHATHPNLYKDPNHKPEMAIALGSFEAFCGFLSFSKIAMFLKHVPALRMMAGDDFFVEYGDALEAGHAMDEPKLLKDAFTRVFSASESRTAEAIKLCISASKDRSVLGSIPSACIEDGIVAACKELSELYEYFGCDAGIFAVFFLQRHKLESGEALFIPPNVLHAYIRGNCVECMASSDNVLRGGMTTKHKDIKLLSDILCYGEKGSSINRVVPGVVGDERIAGGVMRIYRPPPEYPEFEIVELRMSQGGRLKGHSFSSSGPSIALMMQGQATISALSEGTTRCTPLTLTSGNAVLIRSNAVVALETTVSCDSHGSPESRGLSESPEGAGPVLDKTEDTSTVIFVASRGTSQSGNC